MPTPTWHPSADDLGRCLRGEFPEAEVARVSDHVDGCPDCQAALEQVSRPAPPPLGTPPDIPGFAILGDGTPIGEGGMGEVFRAVEAGIGREVAIKIIHRSHAGNPHRGRLVRRFEEEVRLLGRIQHAGVPPVYRFGWAAADQPYLVMRLIPWPTLADELAADWAPGKDGPAPDRLNQYLIWFSRACEAVAYAHDHGAVHLDLKPANVKAHRSGEVQVLDWGLGRGFMATPDGRTHLFSESAVAAEAGPVGHTAEYSPPEQVRGGHPDPKMHPRADVFALGSVLCEVLTGRPAFAGATPEERFNRAWNGDLADARARLAAAARRHPLLVKLALRCLAPDPADRPADAGEVAAEVRGIILSAEDRLRTAKWRFRLGAGLAAAAVLAAAAAGGFAYWKSEADRKEVLARLREKDLEDQAEDLKRQTVRDARERAEAAARDHLRGAEAAETRAAGRDFAHPVARGEAEKDWKAAAELAKAADDAIRGREVDPDLGERIRTATRKVEKGYADFRADRALVDALEVARAHKVYYQDQDGEVGYSGEYFYSRFGKRAFGDAFKAAGLDPEARPDALVEYAGTRGRILGPVVAALDQWYLLDRTPERRWLLRLADRLDTDRHRKNVRAAVGEGWHGVNAVVVDIPRADLSPEAALLAAAGLEDWSRQDGAQAGGERSGPPRRKRGIDEAIKVLARVAPTVRGWDAYWVRLTLGFYLWNASGDQDDWQGGTAEAVEHLAEAERLLADPDATAAADPSTVGVLRAAAGGLRGYIVARRSTVQEVRGRLDEALRKYPGYSPLWQLAVLVRLDRGDRDAALKLAQEWARRGQSDVARGYIHLVESFADASPLEAQTALDGLSRQTASIFVQCQIKDLRAATTRWAPPDRAAPIPPALHPTRPGRELVLVLDARRRFDRVLSPVPVGLPGTGVVLRRWWAESDEAAGGGLGRAGDDHWVSPQRALDGYRRAGAAVPWATGPVFGMVRAKLAAGAPAEAAELADGLAAHVGLPPREGLYHVFRARLHFAAADWEDTQRRAGEHLGKAVKALEKAVEEDPLLKPLAAAVLTDALKAGPYRPLAWPDNGGGLSGGDHCGLAGEVYHKLGPCWLTARLASRPFRDDRGFRDPAFQDNPFAKAATVFGGEVAVARAVVLAVWGCPKAVEAEPGEKRSPLPFLGIPPDPKIDPQTRLALLGKLRERVGEAAGQKARVHAILNDPVVRVFARDIFSGAKPPPAATLAEASEEGWANERKKWDELLELLKGRGLLPDGFLPG